jgi:DNA-binding transcriptional regulator YdaS (Cro superfamily)
MLESMSPLDEAIELFGGVQKLAEAVGVSQSTISNARKRESVSPRLAEKIEKASVGRVSRVALVWPPQEQEAS